MDSIDTPMLQSENSHSMLGNKLHSDKKNLLDRNSKDKRKNYKYSDDAHTPDAATIISRDTVVAAYICLFVSDMRPIYEKISNFTASTIIPKVADWRPCTEEEVNELGRDYNFRASDFHNRPIGFDSWLFRHISEEKYMMATDGTNFTFNEGKWKDSLADIAQDLSQGLLFGLSLQHSISVHLAKKVSRAVGDNRVLWFVGHSLGGGLAANNSLVTQRHAITFNAAGLNIARVKLSIAINNSDYLGKGGHKMRNERIHSFILEGEILNRWISTTAFGLGAYGNRGSDITKTDYIWSIATVGKWTGAKHCMESITSEIEHRKSWLDYYK